MPRKNDFVEGFKILLDTDLKLILLEYQNKCWNLKLIMSNAAKNLDILLV